MTNSDIMRPDDSNRNRMISVGRKTDGLAYQIRQEINKLNDIMDQIVTLYSMYVESDDLPDTEIAVHNGLANILKLIEVQNITKLRIKKMQIAMTKMVSEASDDDALPYDIKDMVDSVNVGFLDSKLVRAYGEIAKVLKADIELTKERDTQIQFIDSFESDTDSNIQGDEKSYGKENDEQDDEQRDPDDESEL